MGCQVAYLPQETGVPLKSILLVDESKFQRMANESVLSRAGYKVVTASDGEEALLIAHDRIPDLILLDMMFPKLEGQEVRRALKQNPVTASIPVIVLSGLAQRNEAKLMQEGATACFDKSKLENVDLLTDLVKTILDGVAAV
jgi:CheY-like chemotaxis protein